MCYSSKHKWWWDCFVGCVWDLCCFWYLDTGLSIEKSWFCSMWQRVSVSFLPAVAEMKLVEHSFGAIMKGWHGPCSRTKVVKDKRNSKSVSSEVLNIFYSMTCEYKPKSSAGLSSLLLNCGEREEGDDLSAILLQRNFHLACWSRWWGIIVCCEIP